MNRFMNFLNTSFGLWFLSAVFLSGTGGIYSCWQKDRDADQAQREKSLEAEKIRLQKTSEDERENKAAIERLDLEISYRFSQVLLNLRSISEQGSKRGSIDSTQRKLQIAGPSMGVMQALARKPSAEQPPLYPDYTAWALPTLISELRRRVPAGDRSDIDRSLARLLGESTSQLFKTDDPAREAAGRVLDDVMLSRWKDTAFYLVDCSARDPFC
jgi:hypothetical protein